ncbi:MAG: cell division/cell wall cluster transcriptional repressor MraZ [Paludibacter sp.]|jgi:MraZ protein|nr:cell division/cell wall cluster transcriptional repressor MraZ [Paludibacter sp.]
MSTFIGKYDAKADVKGRIFIPSTYRKVLPDGEKERVVMRKDAENECLILFPENVWNKKVSDLQSNLDEWNPVDQLLLMQFVSDAEWLDIDSQGRILISKKNLRAIGVDNSEVLFVGLVDRIAVWSKSHYEESKMSSPDFAALLKDRMMKKPLTLTGE